MSIPALNRGVSFAELATPDDIQAESSTSSSRLQKKTTVIHVRTDIRYTPPVFFDGASCDKCDQTIESTETTQSDMISGYGNRRLSRVLAESVADANKTSPSLPVIPEKKINVASIDPDKGIFGNGRICTKHRDSANEPNSSSNLSHQDKGMEKADIKKTRSIRVFGYPPDSVVSVLHHFSKFGEIEDYKQSSGNWISIVYKESDYAMAALMSNGTAIFNECPVGVVLEYEPEGQPTQISFQESHSANGLGSGIAGSSVRHKDDMGLGIFEHIKEFLLGW